MLINLEISSDTQKEVLFGFSNYLLLSTDEFKHLRGILYLLDDLYNERFNATSFDNTGLWRIGSWDNKRFAYSLKNNSDVLFISCVFDNDISMEFGISKFGLEYVMTIDKYNSNYLVDLKDLLEIVYIDSQSCTNIKENVYDYDGYIVESDYNTSPNYLLLSDPIFVELYSEIISNILNKHPSIVYQEAERLCIQERRFITKIVNLFRTYGDKKNLVVLVDNSCLKISYGLWNILEKRAKQFNTTLICISDFII